MRTGVLPFLLILIVAMLTPDARSEKEDSYDALRRLFREGNALSAEGKHAKALAKYKRVRARLHAALQRAASGIADMR